MSEVKRILMPLGIGAGVVVVLLLVGFATVFAYARSYQDRIFPGISVLGIDVGGQSRDQAKALVTKAVRDGVGKGFSFVFRGKTILVPPTYPVTNPDVAHDLVTYNVEKAVTDAYQLGREGNGLGNIFELLRIRMASKDVSVDAFLDRPHMDAAIREVLSSDLKLPEDASLKITPVTGTAPMVPVVEVVPGTDGTDVKTEDAMKVLERQARVAHFSPIQLAEAKSEQRVKASDLEPLAMQAREWLSRPSLVFTYGGSDYPVDAATLGSWIVASGTESGLKLAIDGQRFREEMARRIPDMEQEGKQGALEVKDGKIVSFAPGMPGRRLDEAETLRKVMAEWPATTTFPLVVVSSGGELQGMDPERLGIRELIGVGKSNFSGSPSNRRKNITLGAQRVNGTIVGPGEEFSMIKTLGEIDGAHGWLPELVIKGNKTIPEFGGGLCQIGTTAFRGALNSGLKITQRQNHSYRVRYYEPAGTDATIYDPAPDFRFVNDTANSVLINAYIKGDEVTFEFWGTKDGRIADPIKPRIYNITPPPPTKTIETTDLAPGQKKCTETAHAGADASFTYHVTYADKTEYKQEFTSHYRPWQAVCLVGVEKPTTPVPASPLLPEVPATPLVP